MNYEPPPWVIDFANMNDKQKIFVLLGVGSIMLLLISIFGFEWDFSEVWIAKRSDGRIDPTLGMGTKYDLEYFFRRDDHGIKNEINWIGITSLFTLSISATGFFLFKDK
jgi:hypothetical protein